MPGPRTIPSRRCEDDAFFGLRGRRILLVDADEWIRNSLSSFFETEGCHCQAVETAEQALEQLAGREVDIILTDYRLPGIDGLELLRRIRNLPSLAKKVFITTYRDRGISACARELGAGEVLEKPLTADALRRSLARLQAARKRGAPGGKGP